MSNKVNPRRETALNLAINVAAPIALFYGLHGLGLGQWPSLLLAGVPPFVHATWSIARRRRIDMLAVFALSILVLSGLVSLVSGSPRFLLAKDGWLTGVAGLWMLGTLAGRRPFLYQAVRSVMRGEGQERAETAWRDSHSYRRTLRILTTMWGTVLVLDAGVRVLLAYTLPVDRVPLIGGLQYIGVYVALELVTRLYGRRSSFLDSVLAESGQDFRKK